MSKTATPTITVTLQGDGVISLISPSLDPNTSSPYEVLTVTLTDGPTTITPPSSAKYAMIVPPVNGANTKTLKGVSGDTGIPLSLSNPSFISLASSPSSFVITANGSEVIQIYFF